MLFWWDCVLRCSWNAGNIQAVPCCFTKQCVVPNAATNNVQVSAGSGGQTPSRLTAPRFHGPELNHGRCRIPGRTKTVRAGSTGSGGGIGYQVSGAASMQST
jgi:hypothetical protein